MARSPRARTRKWSKTGSTDQSCGFWPLCCKRSFDATIHIQNLSLKHLPPMAKEDPFFRFPLPALAYADVLPGLEAILRYSLVSAGRGARQTMGKEFETFARGAAVQDWGDQILRLPKVDYRNALDVAAGGQLCNVLVHDWRGAHESHVLVEAHIQQWQSQTEEIPSTVTIKAEWLWNAIDTYLVQTGQPPRHDSFDPKHSWLTPREFRILCALFSVIGKKSFAWVSWRDLQHRSCGFTSRAAFDAAAHLPEHLPLLTRWKIDSLLATLEANRFFLRYRLSSSTKGGRTAYSIRHSTPAALAEEVAERLRRRDRRVVVENRQRDRGLQQKFYPKARNCEKPASTPQGGTKDSVNMPQVSPQVDKEKDIEGKRRRKKAFKETSHTL